MVQAVPEGARTVTPYLTVKGASKALAFYKAAFGATELVRMPGPGGMLMHAEIRIGDSLVYFADAFPPGQSPLELGGTPIALHLYVEDCDFWFARAVKAGCKVVMPLADQFWGDRFGQVQDPFGHLWSIASHVADPTPEQMQAAMASLGDMARPAKKKARKKKVARKPAQKVAAKSAVRKATKTPAKRKPAARKRAKR